MAFALDPARPLLAQLRKIAHHQVDRAIDDLDAPDDVGEAVHDCRTRCKKLRAVVRIVRPGLGPHYGRANATFREAAHHLGPLRDAPALLATFDAMLVRLGDQLPPGGLPLVRAELLRRRDAATAMAVPDGPEIREALARLRDGRDLIDGWRLDGKGFEAIGDGVVLGYRRGRRALRSAGDAPSALRFHELRKRVKDTWYHLRLLEPRAPSVLRPLARSFHDLAGALGDEHDLAVVAGQLLAEPDRFGGDPEVTAAMVLIDGQRADLQRRALRLGARLYAERPGAFVDRLAAYDRAWHETGGELAAGPIGSLG